MVVLAEAFPPFAFIDDGWIFVNLSEREIDWHHQDASPTRFQDAIQLAQGFSVVRHVLQHVRTDKKIKLTVPVGPQVSDINLVVDALSKEVCRSI